MTSLRRRSFITILAVVLVFSTLGVAVGDATQSGGTFRDVDGNVHEGFIEAIAAEGITRGCNPPTNDLYCQASR